VRVEPENEWRSAQPRNRTEGGGAAVAGQDQWKRAVGDRPGDRGGHASSQVERAADLGRPRIRRVLHYAALNLMALRRQAAGQTIPQQMFGTSAPMRSPRRPES
jgi:hypothetical protein